MNRSIIKSLLIILCCILFVACFACTRVDKEQLAPTDFTTEPTTKITTDPTVNAEQCYIELDMEMFVWYTTQDFTYLQQLITEPEAYGINTSEISVTLGDYSVENSAVVKTKCQEFLSRLENIDRDLLNDEYKFALDTAKQYLQFEIESADSFLFEEPLDLYVGIQANLPIYFALYRLETEEDVENYLTLLSDVPRYLDQILAHEQLRAQNGIFMTENALDRVLADIDAIVDNEQPCFLLESFEKAIVAMESLGLDEKQEYIDRNADLIEECYLGAFSNLRNAIEQLRPYCRTDDGLYHLGANARQYFETAIKVEGSSDISVMDAREALEQSIADIQLMLATLYMEDPQIFEYPNVITKGTLQKDEEYLLSLITNIVPLQVEVDIEYVEIPAELQSVFSPAAYLIPSIDGWRSNTVLINPSSKTDLFTLAHEVYPGHLYQYTYQRANNGVSLFNQVIDPIGYVEGWAMNAERYVAMYATDIGAAYCQSVCLDSHLMVITQAASSIMVNYYGYSQEQLEQYLDQINMGVYAAYMYRNAVDMPIYYFKYALGYVNQQQIAQVCQEIALFDWNEYHHEYLNLGQGYYNLIMPKMLEWARRK